MAEQVLFTELQFVATPEQLPEIERLHPGQRFVEEWEYRFWE